MRCCLVLIASAGIQGYIFDTNKRRENVGASHLVASVGEWTVEALSHLVPGWQPTTRTGDDFEESGVLAAELVSKSAGSAKAVVSQPALAHKLVAAVTRRALREAPGLDVCGVFVEFDWSSPGAAASADKEVHDLLPAVRAGRPGPVSRFAQLPLVARCTSSGLPASRLRPESLATLEPDERPELTARSRTSTCKLDAADDGYTRLARLAVAPATGPAAAAAAAKSLHDAREGVEAVADYFERRAQWVAVVHADGNGLGAAVNAYRNRLKTHDNRTFLDGLRGFSAGIDDAAQAAYRLAVEDLWSDPRIPKVRRDRQSPPSLPLLPLVLGGDDLTLVCDGTAALGFTEAYLRHFEEQTVGLLGDNPVDVGVATDRLSACAGVAIVKAKYPFSAAYRLAEDLMHEAKQVKRAVPGPSSALSFHVLHDSASVSLDDLRDRQTAPDGERLVAQPYVLTGARGGWAAHRHWDDLLRRVAALRAVVANAETDRALSDGGDSGDGEGGARRVEVPGLPRSQTHRLRDALFEGRSTAEARVDLVRHRYGRRGLLDLTVDGSLFWPEEGSAAAGTDQPTGRWVTGLLDAMDAEPFVGSLPDLEGVNP